MDFRVLSRPDSVECGVGIPEAAANAGEGSFEGHGVDDDPRSSGTNGIDRVMGWRARPKILGAHGA